jgi:hypothetical protein
MTLKLLICIGEIKKKAKEKADLIAHKTVCLGVLNI